MGWRGRGKEGEEEGGLTVVVPVAVVVMVIAGMDMSGQEQLVVVLDVLVDVVLVVVLE